MKNRIISLFCAGTAALFMLSGCSAVRQIAAMENPTDETLEDASEEDIEEDIEEHIEEDIEEHIEELIEELTEEEPENTEEQEDIQDVNEPVDETEYPVTLQQGVYPDWKASYKALMREIMENSYGVDGYYLYDVDKDGIPEITVEFGDCEASYGGGLYTFDGEKAVYAGEFRLGHSGLATCPSQNGMILSCAHMGVAYMQKITLENGQLGFEDLLEETLEDWDDTYTHPGEIIPGADYLSEMKPGDTLPMDTYGIWLGNMRAEIDATTTADEALEQRYLDIILQNGTIVGITADGFGGDLGTCTMEEYLGPNMVEKYADAGMVVEAYTYIDMNGDGTEECVLRLGEADPEEAYYVSDLWVVLSEQDGTMYAYCINYSASFTLLENGTFRPDGEYYVNNFRMLFDKDQCFLYNTWLDEKHAEQEWIDIAVEE